MSKFLSLFALLSLLLFGACGDDDSRADGGAEDAAADSSEQDADSQDAPSEDASTDDASTEDASTEDAGSEDSGSEDAGSEDAGSEDSGSEDAGSEDAGSEDAAMEDAAMEDSGMALEPGPIQCVSNEDCDGPVASCNRSAPGGICLGCAPGSCGSGTECMFGSCVRLCDADDECNAGFQCLGSGRCALRSCVSDEDCGPYVCGDDARCERPRCADGCPDGWSCGGTICIEPA